MFQILRFGQSDLILMRISRFDVADIVRVCQIALAESKRRQEIAFISLHIVYQIRRCGLNTQHRAGALTYTLWLVVH